MLATNCVRRAIGRLTGSGSLFKNIVAMLTGTAAAQAVNLAMTIPLARLYEPAQFGLYAIMHSVAAVGITMAALRYDLATVLPEKETEARVIQRLASRAILVTSSILCIGLLVYVALSFDSSDGPMLGYWLVAVGVLVFLGAQIATRQYWLTRQHDFKTIASNRVLAATATGLCQIAGATITRGFEGLIVGHLVGQLVTLGWVIYRTRTLSQPLGCDAPSISKMAKRYRKMPLVNGPNALLDAVRESGINLLIANIAVAGLGQYNMANRLAGAPVGIISGSVSQVFLHRMATTQPGKMTTFVKRVLIRIGLVSAPLFGVFYMITPTVFPLLLGAEWAESGRFAQALIPWLFLRTFTSPLSNVFIVTERQEWPLIFAFPYTLVPLSILAFTNMPLLETVRVLGFAMAVLLFVWTFFALLAARMFDRSQRAVQIES